MELLENEVELVNELCERIKREQAKKPSKIPMTILDIGCGTGKLARYLSEETGCGVIGIDPVEVNIAKAQIKSPAVTFMVHSAELMSFANDAFNFVVSLKALHEIPNPHEALKESHRVLRKKGKIFIVDWLGGVAQTSSHGHAKNYFSMQRMKEVLSEAGFANVRIKTDKERALMLAEGDKV